MSVDYGVKSENVVAIMYDCASANEVEICALQVLYPAVLGIGCFSHTLNSLWEKNLISLMFMSYYLLDKLIIT